MAASIAGIDAVGLGDLPCGPGEIPRPGRVHPREGQVRGRESVPQQAVVASRRLEEHEGAVRLEALGKLTGAGLRIAEAFGLSGPAIKNVKMGLGDIDSSKTRVYDHGAYSCATRSVSAASINCSGWVVQRGRAIRPIYDLRRSGTHRSPARQQDKPKSIHRDPDFPLVCQLKAWVPAFAGMTDYCLELYRYVND